MMPKDAAKLPRGWVATRLSEIVVLNPPKSEIDLSDNELVTFLPMAAVEAGSGLIDASNVRPWGEVKKGYTAFREGDILFAKITPCMENGKFALAHGLRNRVGAGSTEFHVLRALPGISSKLVLFYLLQESYRRDARTAMRGAAGQLRVPESFLAESEYNLPPQDEQTRIVEEIEKQFSRLDAGVAALKRVQANLKRYRASVLKAACEGRLVPTEAELAHAEGRDYEPADKLLQRILVERRRKWQETELAKMQAKGKTPKDDKWKSRYQEPAAPDTSDLPELPDGWCWTSVEQIAVVQGGIQKQPTRAPADNAYPFLRVANVMRNSLELTEVHKIELFANELGKYRLEEGDLLIVDGNGSPTEIGRMAVWSGAIADCVHQNHIIRARLISGIMPALVSSYWSSPDGSERVCNVASTTTGLHTLSVGKIERLPVPLPPAEEQPRITAEVERVLSILAELEFIVEANVKRAERLRQSILKRAFEGKLVPQGPIEELASALLERIKAEGQELDKSSRNGKATKRTLANISGCRGTYGAT